MLLRNSILICVVLLLALTLSAQQNAMLPDAPSVSSRRENTAAKRTLRADDPYRPLSDDEKLHYWVTKAYSPYTFFSAGLSTAYTSAVGDYRYCCAGTALAKEYVANVLDAQSRNFFGRFLFPTMLDQDPRYLPKRKGGLWSRGLYAATRVLITRNDDGHTTFNSSELLAVSASQALSNAYYPERYRNWGNTGQRILGSLQGDAGSYLLKEFMPDIKRVFRSHTPQKLQGLADAMSEE